MWLRARQVKLHSVGFSRRTTRPHPSEQQDEVVLRANAAALECMILTVTRSVDKQVEAQPVDIGEKLLLLLARWVFLDAAGLVAGVVAVSGPWQRA
mmetsp:Transcript_8929/g.16053  ORF Transcript_8929/g.16053 Transcript_8929/m.16053 type:complete len:96 (+) Transcript_8929:2164-2451(+)